jgi:filamentous hemagglutinin
VGGTQFYTPDQVIATPGSAYLWLKNPDGSQGALLGSSGWGIWNTTYTTTADTAINAQPASITSGSDMTLNGAVTNANSKIVAGGTLTTSAPPNNVALQGHYTTTGLAIVYNQNGQLQPLVILPTTSGSVDVGAFTYVHNTSSAGASVPGAAGGGSTGTQASGSGAGSSGSHTATIVEVPANVGGVAGATGSPAGGASGASGASGTGSSPAVPMVVRTSSASTALPSASLFKLQPGANSHYLVETDPRFADYRTWLSSDYLLDKLGLDPNTTMKRLGDGFYEQQLIDQQVMQLTGYRYVEGFGNDTDEYTALMNAGATFARQYNLTVGVALTAAQMAQLTSDIVWLVQRTVTLPDGSTQQVLVPQVYVRVQPGDIDGSGALLSADQTVIKGSGDLTNTGTIAGRTLVKINADNIDNLAGRISGGSVALNATHDVNNIGGTIDAKNALSVTAGHDINVKTTTASGSAGNANIDRVAGLYVSNPGGTLVASAGNDMNLVGAIVANAGGGAGAGKTVLHAGNDLNLATVTTATSAVAVGRELNGSASTSQDIGTQVLGGGDVKLDAGHDVSATAATVSAVGNLGVKAGNDITIGAGQQTSDFGFASVSTHKNLLSQTVTTTEGASSTDTPIASSFSGGKVTLDAGRDITVDGSSVYATDALKLSAGRDVNIGTAQSSSSASLSQQVQSTPTGLAKALGAPAVAIAASTLSPPDSTLGGLLTRKQNNVTDSQSSTQALGSTLSGGSIDIHSGRDTTITGSTLVADGDIGIDASRNLTIQSAQDTSDSQLATAFKGSGNLGTFIKPAMGRSQDTASQGEQDVTQAASQVASLNGNVTLKAGGTYTQTASDVLALGTGADGNAGNIDIMAKTVVINEAYDTTTRTSASQGSQLTLGGTASVPLLNAIKSTAQTAQATGRTGDSRMQALGAADTAMEAANVAQMVAQGGSLGGYKVGVALTSSQYQSQESETTSTVVGSTVSGAGNVSIKATGGGAASDITATAANIQADGNVELNADNAITLQAAQSTDRTTGSSSSSSASIGVSWSVGAQNGVTIDLGASQGKGNELGSDVTNANTHVTAGNTVNLHSGGDTTLKGAVVAGETVNADVGGNLTIQSLQDTSFQNDKQSSSGGNLSLCIPPICGGAVVMGSAYTANARGNTAYASVTEQSGIQAGDGGFSVNVAGNTKLVGSVIESTQAAVDAGANSFKTGGTLTTSNIVNTSVGSASGYSVGGSYTSAYADADGKSVPEQRTPSAGIGSASSPTQTSLAISGISGIAGNTAVRTGDTSSAGTLARPTDVNSLMNQVGAQVTVTAVFSQQASFTWGQYADKQYTDAVGKADEEGAACWAPAGACRAVGHAIIGGLTGDAAGAIGAGASSLTSPAVYQMLNDLGVPDAISQGLTIAYAAGLGSVAGGTAGAAAGLNEAANNSTLAARLILETVELGGPSLAQACLKMPSCVGLLGATALNAIASSSSTSGPVTMGDVNPTLFMGSDATQSADTYGVPPSGTAPLPNYGGTTTTPATPQAQPSTTTTPGNALGSQGAPGYDGTNPVGNTSTATQNNGALGALGGNVVMSQGSTGSTGGSGLSMSDILLPNGQPVGYVSRGAGAAIQTVSPSQFDGIQSALLDGAAPIATPSGYAGTWYQRSDGTIFGIRASLGSGATIDVIQSDNPNLPSGFKIHQK